MSSFNGKRLPEISDDKQFEKFACDLWQSQYPDASVTLYGRSGQAQYGVDVLVRSGNRVIGVQCKAVKNLDTKTIDTEVSRAKEFAPALTDLIMVTIAPHDAKLVTYTATLTQKHKKSGHFAVSYHGWDDLLRILEDHPLVVQKYFSQFFRSSDEQAAPQPPIFCLPLDSNLNIVLSDKELALFCSEASWGLKNDPSAIFTINHADAQRVTETIAAIEATGALDIEARSKRSNLQAYLAYISPKIRKAEVAAKLLLTDDVVRSPWLIGGCWPETAATMRRLMPQNFNWSDPFPRGLTLKISPEDHPELVGYVNLDADDRLAFEAHCDAFKPDCYFLGSVVDLGADLGLKYALPAGIAALVNYSASSNVPIETLQNDRTNSIYFWKLYPV
ncbi:restriction endonuclease [Gluconobacter sp. P5B12]|uniref:restriction endonuclease n=1 Tax=unclassified Gluconobacter TaxID=2644261 RepID=UPI001C045B5A|nr:restriction endonuclease [Gluconobacter sp. P5B12]